MLTFACDNCQETFPATLGLKGLIVAGEQIKNESDPCPNCMREAEAAREEVLKKRRKL